MSVHARRSDFAYQLDFRPCGNRRCACDIAVSALLTQFGSEVCVAAATTD
jgi:hypothetical protein